MRRVATIEQSSGTLGMRISGRLHAAGTGLSPASRAAAIREAARAFRRVFEGHTPALRVRAVDMTAFSAPARAMLSGPATATGALVVVVARMLVVGYEDFGGDQKTLLWEPMLADAVAEARLCVRRPSRRLGGVRGGPPRQLCAVRAALAGCGIAAEEIDFVGFGDLRGHDLGRVAGTEAAPTGAHQPRAGLFERARLLVSARELETACEPHPLEASWYVPRAAEDLPAGRIVALEGDVQLGPGIAVIATPGLTPGHQSLVLRAPDGIWVVSSNGVAVECWQPLLSKIPGVRRGTETDELEVMLPAEGVHAPLALYDSMVLERWLADASRDDPRWLRILPQRELARRVWQWPLLPTFSHSALTVG